MRYTLRQLEVFLAVARSESVSRAATELAMSQSAVSGSLLDLERQFEIDLFDRIGKRLRLSSFGRSVRARAEALYSQARELESAFANERGGEVLRVGATLTIGNYVTVPLLARYLREQEGARVTLEVANTAEIARRVANFELDVGLVEGELSAADLDVTPWRDDDLVVFCAKDHPFAKKRALTDEDLRRVDWIVRERGSGTQETFERAMHGILPDLRIALELQHIAAIKSAVEAGLGFGCVSRIALEDAFGAGTLVPCRVPHRDFGRKFYFVLHTNKHRGSRLEAFLALCRRDGSDRRSRRASPR